MAVRMSPRLGLLLLLGVALPGCAHWLRPSTYAQIDYETPPIVPREAHKLAATGGLNKPDAGLQLAGGETGDPHLQPRRLPQPPHEQEEPELPMIPKLPDPTPPTAPTPPADKPPLLPPASTQPAANPPALNSALATPQPPRREPVVEALNCILENRHNEALHHLQKYDQPTQELFLRLLPAMALLTQKGIDQLSQNEVGMLHDQLHGLLCTLRPRTELTLTKACFCEWVKAYGIYKPLEEGHGFVAPNAARPGELVQLYVELRNFTSALQNGLYTTRLNSSVEIHDQRDPKGKPIWYYRFDDNKQPLRSRTMLHDYFNNYSFYVPNIPPGNYLLTVQIADETQPERRRVARKTLDFRITSVVPGTK